MISFVIFIGVFTIVSGIVFTKKIINPITLYVGLWTIILFLSGLRLYDLRKVSASIYMIISISLIFFAVGFYIMSSWRKKYRFVINKGRINTNKIRENYVIRYKLLYFIGICTILYLARKLPLVVSEFTKGNYFAVVRNLAQDTTSSLNNADSEIINALRVLIFNPFSLAILPITAVDFWMGKRDKKLLLICITIIVMRVLTEGGRIIIVYFAVHLFIAFIYSGKLIDLKMIKEKIRSRRKQIRLLVIVLLVLIVAIIQTSLSREGDRLLRVTYYYFSMQPNMLEIWNNIALERGIVGYGEASLNGFIFPVLYIFKNIFKLSFPEHWNMVYQLILDTDSQWQLIAGSAQRANAYVSNIYFFYVDGRILGVIIGSIIYGGLVGYCYVAVKNNTNMKVVCIYSMLIQCIYMSFSTFQFSSPYFGIALLYIILFAFKRKMTISTA